MKYRFLTPEEKTQLYRTFSQAFSDYIIKLQLTEEQFYHKLQREGVELVLTGGAFQSKVLSGFILSGTGNWNNKNTAYNAGTGVVPAARRKGVASNLYQYMLPVLKQNGIEQCLLEVIQQNNKAFELYLKLGFDVVRELDSFRVAKDVLTGAVNKAATIRFTASPDWHVYKQFWQTSPSWQNMPESVARASEKTAIAEAFVDGNLVGYGIIFTQSGQVAQLAVQENMRGNGIGSQLLHQLKLSTAAPAISFINVDRSCSSLLQYLKNKKVPKLLSQHEMLLSL
ncbi:MAG: GNAT family N-acetyltransferase [Hymenobacteraceae bacterium]|nr:GNAT family N-acetyltransferase [Hymenobacteraceae bacterium]